MVATWFVDSINGHPLWVLFVRGWCTDPATIDVKLEYPDGALQDPNVLCRELRSDVVAVHDLGFPWPGFIAEFHLARPPAAILAWGDRLPVSDPERYCTLWPPYWRVYGSEQVLNRTDIYRSGPPASADPTVADLVSQLIGSRVLDFGCGKGDLVRKLRARGHDAAGIEIDRAEIREDLGADVAQHIILYEGNLPLPYADKSFDSVTAIEVLEHVSDPHFVARELMRIARSSIFVTVPDMACIPFSYPTNTVPWHLLEGTHVNFFTALSLASIFRPAFAPAKSFRLHNFGTAERFIPGSIAMLFTPR